jgi:hypothetical protein
VLVFLALPTGALVLEEAVDDRRYAPWNTRVDKRREALRAPGRSRVSDRAQALIPRAAPGLACLSLPAVFHLRHAMVQSDALAIGRQVRQARQAREPWAPVASREAPRQGETAQAEVRRWETVQREDRQRLEPRSLPRSPFSS